MNNLFQALSGRRLDIVKLIAAALMLLDHINDILFAGAFATPWIFGRGAFPLFAFAFGCSLARGLSCHSKTVARLLLFAIVAIPCYAIAFNKIFYANILFVFAAAVLVDLGLQSRSKRTAHIVFTLGLIWSIPTSLFIEYGAAGVILPIAIARTMRGEKEFAPYVFLCLIMLNANFGAEWIASLIGIFSTLAIPGFILFRLSQVNDGKRFLPKYFLYYFYPAHLAVLYFIELSFFRI